MLRIGCHLSSSKGYEAMAKDAMKIKANTFQFFTRNPRGGNAKTIDPQDVARFQATANAQDITPILAHAPYTLNACSADENIRDFAKRTMTDDLARMEYTPGNMYNFHPGSHVKQGVEVGITYIAQMLNEILTPDQSTTVLLETMAGKGSGYDIANHLDEVLDEFDRIIGLSRLKAIHLNNTQNPLGAHKDRHATLTTGHIPLEALIRIINHPALRKLPYYLETPNDLDGYAAEIALMRDSYIE